MFNRHRPLLTFLGCCCLLATQCRVWAHEEFGVVDRNGKCLIEFKFRKIRILPGDYLLLKLFDDKNVFDNSYANLLADSLGRLINVNLPAGFTLADVILPQSANGTKQLPQKTIFVIHGARGFALSDLNGRILLQPADYSSIESVGEGMFELHTNSGRFLFNSATAKMFPLIDHLSGQFKNCEASIYQGRYHLTSAIVDKAGNMSVLAERHKDRFDKFAYIGPFVDDVAVALGDGRFGLLDKSYRWVTSTDYSSMERLFPHIYGAQRRDDKRFVALDDTGKQIFAFPEDVLNIEFSNNESVICQLRKLKEDERIPFHNRFGAFDKAGNLLWTYKGKFVHHDSGRFITLVGEKTVYLDESGRIVGFAGKPLTPNLFLKSEIDPRFSKRDWTDGGPEKGRVCIDRLEECEKLIHDYELIDMSRKSAMKLLGRADQGIGDRNILQYSLLCGDCGNMPWTALELKFEQDRVKCWRIAHYPGFGSPGGAEAEDKWISKKR